MPGDGNPLRFVNVIQTKVLYKLKNPLIRVRDSDSVVRAVCVEAMKKALLAYPVIALNAQLELKSNASCLCTYKRKKKFHI